MSLISRSSVVLLPAIVWEANTRVSVRIQTACRTWTRSDKDYLGCRQNVTGSCGDSQVIEWINSHASVRVCRTCPITWYIRWALSLCRPSGCGVRHGAATQRRRVPRLSIWCVSWLIRLVVYCDVYSGWYFNGTNPSGGLWLYCDIICCCVAQQCNNPKTKEPKLNAAMRIIAEWKDNDQEIKQLYDRVYKSPSATSTSSTSDSSSSDAQSSSASTSG